jgi:hypothetical protein
MIQKEIVDLISALLTPIIAIIAAYVAYQQWETNKQRLNAELYDRRFIVYETLMDTIGEAIRIGDISDGQLQKFSIQRRKSHFLFGKNVCDYLEEIYDRLVDLQTMNQASTQEKAENAKRRGDLKKWLCQQIKVAGNKFQDDLSVK